MNYRVVSLIAASLVLGFFAVFAFHFSYDNLFDISDFEALSPWMTFFAVVLCILFYEYRLAYKIEKPFSAKALFLAPLALAVSAAIFIDAFELFSCLFFTPRCYGDWGPIQLIFYPLLFVPAFFIYGLIRATIAKYGDKRHWALIALIVVILHVGFNYKYGAWSYLPPTIYFDGWSLLIISFFLSLALSLVVFFDMQRFFVFVGKYHQKILVTIFAVTIFILSVIVFDYITQGQFLKISHKSNIEHWLNEAKDNDDDAYCDFVDPRKSYPTIKCRERFFKNHKYINSLEEAMLIYKDAVNKQCNMSKAELRSDCEDIIAAGLKYVPYNALDYPEHTYSKENKINLSIVDYDQDGLNIKIAKRGDNGNVVESFDEKRERLKEIISQCAECYISEDYDIFVTITVPWRTFFDRDDAFDHVNSFVESLYSTFGDVPKEQTQEVVRAQDESRETNNIFVRDEQMEALAKSDSAVVKKEDTEKTVMKEDSMTATQAATPLLKVDRNYTYIDENTDASALVVTVTNISDHTLEMPQSVQSARMDRQQDRFSCHLVGAKRNGVVESYYDAVIVKRNYGQGDNIFLLHPGDSANIDFACDRGAAGNNYIVRMQGIIRKNDATSNAGTKEIGKSFSEEFFATLKFEDDPVRVQWF